MACVPHRPAPLADDGGIRPASSLHAPALAAIHAAAFQPADTWGPDAIALQLEQPGAFGFVHDAGGFVIARVAADEAEILTIAVHPERRRQGIGGALLARAMNEAAARKANALFLEVSSHNLPASKLYATAGFLAVGQRARYYADGSDAIILRALVNNQPRR